MKRRLSQFLRDEEGQSTTEYILIMAVVVMVAMKFKKVFTEQIMDGRLNKLQNDFSTFDNP